MASLDKAFADFKAGREVIHRNVISLLLLALREHMEMLEDFNRYDRTKLQTLFSEMFTIIERGLNE